MKKRTLNFTFVSLLLAAAGNAFSQSPSTTTNNSGPAPFMGQIDIGGRTLEMVTRGRGSPTVIIEAGLGEPAVLSGTWEKVITAITNVVRVCVYDRAGLGTSKAVTNSFRTCQDLADDLHALLVSAKIAPPYILVGHSVGGFTVRLYAAKYPDEVAGVVLVDSSYPRQWSKWQAVLPAESPQEPESIKRMRAYLAAAMADPKSNPERLNLAASSDQVDLARDFGKTPLIVISHSPKWSIDPALPKDVSDKVEKLWQEWQEDLCRLSTRSSHKVAVKAGHYIQPEEPQIVADAILQIAGEIKP